MKQWRCYGAVNNGYDGFLNIPNELTCDDYYSGEYDAPHSHEELIRQFCRARNAHTRNITHIGIYTNLNGNKYRKYAVEVSPNNKREFVVREFKTRCFKVAA